MNGNGTGAGQGAEGRLRVLYSSNAFWAASGYGVQGRSLLPRLAALPEIGGRENMAQFAWYGLQGGVHDVDGFRVYPVGRDAYGNDIIGAHTRDFRANVVISLIDVWVMQETAQKVGPALWLPWLPIDHDPVPQQVLKALEGAYMPITYSKWGHNLLAAAGVPNHYVPHGIEPTVFRVLPDETVRQFRAQVFKDPSHLTVMVAANKGYPDRKAFQVQMRAWAEFAKDKPGARLYVHTEPTAMYGGLEIPELAKAVGIGDKILFPDRYQYFKGYPAEFLALLYNAADVLLSASMAEGFGIPIVEAQACGTPVVVGNYSSMPELVRAGYAVDAADVFWTPMNAWQWWPDVRGIRAALEALWADWHAAGDRWPQEMRAQASAAIHAEFDWDTIVRDQWAPLVAKMAQDAPPVALPRQLQATPVENHADAEPVHA